MSQSGQSDSLVFQGRLPAAFRLIEEEPGPSTLVINNEKNEHTLKSSLISRDPIEVDDNDDLTQQLKRQEAKLDLLLDMVTEILSRQSSIPQEIDVRLTAQRIDWQDATQDYSEGAIIEVDVYITPSIPRPLRFFGRITGSAEGKHSVEFFGVNQQVTDLLDKILFRHHRRAIAQQRFDR
jgi:hypothetical protein